MYDENMLSSKDVLRLSQASRIALLPKEADELCRDLNALLEMSSVLLPLEKLNGRIRIGVGVSELREDRATNAADAREDYTVPAVLGGEV